MLYNKFKISKTDGTPIDPSAKYIVLRYDSKAGNGLSEPSLVRAALLHWCQSNRNHDGSYDDPFFQELWDDVVSEAKESAKSTNKNRPAPKV
jgi:hypothetical protein